MMRLWMLAGLAAFVVQNHCGIPGVSHEQLAVHFLDRGQYERALHEARRAQRESPQDPQPRVITALAQAGLGDDEQAAQALEGALRLDLDDPRLYRTLRSLCADADREDLALRILQGLAEEHPDKWLVRLNLGWAYRATGDDEQAQALLEQVVADADSTAPSSERVVAGLELSRIYVEQERLQDAARILGDAMALDPEDPRLLISAGEVYLRLGQDESAAPLFDKALGAAGDLAAAANRIAMVYYELGDRRKAIDFYERAVDLRPDPLTLNNLAWTYAEADLELEHAQELSLRAVKADADNVVYLDTYAEILFRRGQRRQAVALMQRCLQIEPEDGEHFAYLQGQLTRFRAGAPADP